MINAHTLQRPTLLLSLALFGLAASACTDDAPGDDELGETDESDTGGEGLTIVGDYVDEWGDMHTITEASWTNAGGTFHISSYDDGAGWLVAQNDAQNEFNPELWSRFEWTWSGDALYYCQSVFDGATEDDALAGSADPADLEMGCSGFAWTHLNAG
jgi:hypothetical protein